MEDLAFQKPGSSKDSMKSRSKFYSDLSFEDDFNPTSVKPKQNTTSFTPAFPVHNVTPNSIQRSTTPNFNLSSVKSEASSTPHESVSATDDLDERLTNVHASPLMCYVLRLKHGEELRKTLKAFVKKNALKAAFVLTCVGSAVSAKLRLANATANTEANYMLDIVHPTEIVSLEGTISGGGHLHVALSDATGKMSGGHLIELIVDTTAEVVIGDCSALSFSRNFDQTTGFNELNISMR
ncbi:bifunctional protein GlmU-like [Hydractinia symbiolongicarpus]|uniref:bifunctional protein GlmU-like n=1 Tax=Hydractinia symbiolongicarpus TaxID=13093 RepID=UPI00254BFDAA|nr:bifunctional protein GlmU-like [Hydractinia symbiolongicarpus]